jgi:hypothetical protein
MGLKASIFINGSRAQSLSGNVGRAAVAEFSTAVWLSWQDRAKRHNAAQTKQSSHFMQLNYEKKLMAIWIKF